MGVGFLGLRPMNVLVDRSRDICSGNGLVRLLPVRVFRTTDGHEPLSVRRLAEYDVLGICGNGATGYSAGELAAIEGFVRRGGTLILAASAGVFERLTQRPIQESAAAAVARRFGFGFVSTEGMPTGLDGYNGYEREALELTAEGRATGLALGDLWLKRPGPIEVPAGATALLQAKADDGRPVMAWARHGKGKVLVCGDTETWSTRHSLVAAHWLALVDPAGRVGDRKVPALVQKPYREIGPGSGRVRVFASAMVGARAQRVAELLREAYVRVERIIRPVKRVTDVRLIIESGAGGWPMWGPEEEVEVHVGADGCDGAIVAEVARQAGERMLAVRVGYELRKFVWAGRNALAVKVAREMGFGEYAEQLDRPWRQDAGAVDLGKVYSEVELPGRLRRFWLDAEAALGPAVLRRTLRAVPRKEAIKWVPWNFLSELDVIAHFMARGVGPKVYAWLERQGHTVRRLPLAQTGSATFKQALSGVLGKVLMNQKEEASERFDAAMALAGQLKEAKTGFDQCAKRAAGSGAQALAAAVRLAVAKDGRGREPLRKWLRAKDPGLAAVAALAMVYEYHDRMAADVLARLAGQMDVRFQLAVGYALKGMGDPRAEALSFEKLPGCQMRRVEDGFVKAFPTVQGYEVANVWSMPLVRPGQYGSGYSAYYVQWVHTSPRWRRRGLARLGMRESLNSPWDSRCSMTSLHTGTRNVAHALYRDFGLIDYFRGMVFEKPIHGAPAAVRLPKGVHIRPARPEDTDAALGLINAAAAKRPAEPLYMVRPWLESPERMTFIAERDGKPVGLVTARMRGREAWLGELVVALEEKKNAGTKDEKRRKPALEPREAVGLGLLRAVELAARKRKATKLGGGIWSGFGDGQLAWLCRRAGMGSKPTGGVELFRANSLRQYLEETAPALEGRLKNAKGWSDWCGTIELRSTEGWASEQQAAVEIQRGKVKVAARANPGPTITIRGSTVALQRLCMGITSCFEEYLQIEVEAQPLVNDSVTELLEVVFPRLIAEA